MSEVTKLMTIPEEHVLGSTTSPFSSKTTARTTRAYRSMSLPTISTTTMSFTRNSNSTPNSPTSLFTPLPSPHQSPTHYPQLPHQSPTYYPQLPPDPKRWSSAHVAAYLSYCLRLYPPAVILDLSRCVQEDVTLTGRRFLRLREEQLKQMGISERWIKLIMMGVKALRRDNLTQKILNNKTDGGINGIEEIDEDVIEEENESVSDDHVSETTTSSLTTAASISSSTTVYGNEKEKGTLNHLTDSDKEYIRQELMNLKESLEKELLSVSSFWSNWRFPTMWRTFSFASPVEFIHYGNARFSYGRGLVHGAVVGGMVVLICLRLAAKW